MKSKQKQSKTSTRRTQNAPKQSNQTTKHNKRKKEEERKVNRIINSQAEISPMGANEIF